MKDIIIHARAGNNLRADKGTTVHAHRDSRVYANDGSVVHAFDGSKVQSHTGAVVHAYKGSEVTGWGGSIVHAWRDSQVFGYNTTIYAYRGAQVRGQGVDMEGKGGAIVYVMTPREDEDIVCRTGDIVYYPANKLLCEDYFSTYCKETLVPVCKLHGISCQLHNGVWYVDKMEAIRHL